jgi:hypothetical protein
MVFYQASAPTGWIQDFENGDAALRVINTALTTVTSSTALDPLKVYKILELGNTDFTAFGAGSNAVGVSFKPTQTAWPTAANGNPTSGKLTIGSGGASGGTTGFSSAFPAQSITSSGTEAPTIAHTHAFIAQQYTAAYTDNGGAPDQRSEQNTIQTQSTGVVSGSEAAKHNHTVSVAGGAPKYIDVIVCIKD